MRIMTERYGRPLLDRRRRANSHSPSRPNMMRSAFRRPRAPNINAPDARGDYCRRQLAHGGSAMFATLLGNSPVPRSASIHVYDGLTLAGHRLRLDRLAAMPAFNFLPLGFAHSSREPRKLPTGILRCAAVLKDAASLVSGLSVAIETAMVAARKQSKENYNGEHRHL